MVNKSKYPVGVVIGLAVFYGLLVLLIFEGFRMGGWSILAILLLAFWGLYDYVTRVDFDLPGLARNKNFVALDGTISTAETGLENIGGGRVKITIATKRDYVPEEEWYRMGGMKGIMATLAGQVHIDIVRPSWQVKEITGEELGAKEGAYILFGSLDQNRKVAFVNEELLTKLDYASSIMRKLNSIYEASKSQSATDSKEVAKNVYDQFMEIVPMLREWNQGKQPKMQPLVLSQGREE